jgi:hypothetical protein
MNDAKCHELKSGKTNFLGVSVLVQTDFGDVQQLKQQMN